MVYFAPPFSYTQKKEWKKSNQCEKKLVKSWMCFSYQTFPRCLALSICIWCVLLLVQIFLWQSMWNHGLYAIQNKTFQFIIRNSRRKTKNKMSLLNLSSHAAENEYIQFHKHKNKLPMWYNTLWTIAWVCVCVNVKLLNSAIVVLVRR